ncbi:2-C-methyl-D-erythritol 4-phosphate cytidylyltransferase [Alishewanella sp. HH-ZS]|jgi:2-C-methyl-D-erythritol 4-phosphate cytidylyltransferase|uniref:2-C-methyl-D-erythritol 4-phosphate cytidylyltransferase n=1 Tax=Alishewanella sp. HH-ZS TaxID=1856684 RepID=UPI0008236DE2|nr:2-C-methyl-D-erythritol 4-phosphate cytidylyltransferase [Alishewanella sp. HH-ZS]OCW98519.1 2-C-methyl-D-erythritol 4-phosphate cytidylyltransferase [Alishewanella sp. HH-ZS]
MAVQAFPAIAAVIPAAGVGQRMQADKPKQYLRLHGKTVLEHSVRPLLALEAVTACYLALSEQDPYFAATGLTDPRIVRVNGGSERVHSVFNALQQIDAARYPWVLVHDAARPLVRVSDIQLLIERCLAAGHGGILATPVRDTMKRGRQLVDCTVDRTDLWHALTPQFFPTTALRQAIAGALAAGVAVTDEASAMEWAQQPVLLVEGHSDNLKITRPADLQLAAFYLEQPR